MSSIGIMFRCKNAPEDLILFSKEVESAGFDELWIVEDCFFAGGIASVSTALANTQSIRVGLGIMPAVGRNPAFAAMEIALLARIYPGRFLPGFGHGVGDWMKQIGAFPSSQLAALEEVTLTVRDLLAGKTVNFDGKHVHLDHVTLDFPPQTIPGISLGVRGPKSLQISGRVADGTILAEHASAEYVSWAIEQIRIGQEQGGRSNEPHRVTVYTFCSMDDDHDTAIQKLRPLIIQGVASGNLFPYLEPLGIVEEAKRLIETGTLETHMPDEWVTKLAVSGTPAECQAAIQKLMNAGADSVVLVPIEEDFETMTALCSKANIQNDVLLP